MVGACGFGGSGVVDGSFDLLSGVCVGVGESQLGGFAFVGSSEVTVYGMRYGGDVLFAEFVADGFGVCVGCVVESDALLVLF